MVRFLKRLLSKERGQALPIVLGLLAIGGLTIAVSLNYATTSLKGSRIIEEKTEGVYAAAAGVEYTLWSLGIGGTPPAQLSENINQMAVGIQTENLGIFTWYLGELIAITDEHVEWLDVSGNITDLGGNVYQYTITVTWQTSAGESGEPPIKLAEIGARLPVGYSYQAGSAASFPGNLSLGEPTSPIQTDPYGAYLPNWVFGTPRPQVSATQPTRSQSFYITGTESLEDEYVWVVAEREDIGQVGEITGTRYKITATATRPEDGRTTAEIVADVIIKDDGKTNIVSWQITK